MSDNVRIRYRFRFEDGTDKEFPLELRRSDLSLVPVSPADPPAWTVLLENRCCRCAIDPVTNIHCPVALNLAWIAHEFRDFFAYESATVEVVTNERTCLKQTTIQEGLGSLIGIVMVTSGCPTMEFLKPLARFHLPFANMHETFFRAACAYLMSRYLRAQNGLPADLEVTGLGKIYEGISEVNRDFALRMQAAAKKDANANALVNLDCFAGMLPFALDDFLEEIKPYFGAYLKEGSY